jgi:acyl dehydratase
MAKQIYYKEVNTGDSLPTLIKHPTPRQLVMWAGASEEYTEYHYDKDFALSQGLPGIIVHGMLTASFLAQLVTDWMGDLGTLKMVETNNRAMLFPNQDIICKGRVAKKYSEDKEHFVECEIWAENSKGEKCVAATALVTLPDNN